LDITLNHTRRSPAAFVRWFMPLMTIVRRHNHNHSRPRIMNIVLCTHDRHASQILDVFNDAILTSTALFDYKPRSPDSMIPWFKTKASNQS
jgi:hypothetical protein